MRNLNLRLLITSALNASAAFAQAVSETLQDTYPPETEEIVPATLIPIPQEADTQTQLWLQLQTSGAMRGSHFSTPGQAATSIYKRYLDSFTYPIPEEFEYEDKGSSGSSGSSTSR